MINKTRSLKALLIVLFIFVSVFGYTSTAFAEEINQPNYGGPIIVDGVIDDWELTADFFVVMTNDQNGLPEADAYLRFNGGNLYILVISRTGQDVEMDHGQFVGVDGDNPFDVTQDDAPPDGTLPDMAFYQPGTTLAQGWEAGIVWADAINPDAAEHEIQIHAFLNPNRKLSAKVPIKVLEFDFGDLPEGYGTLLVDNGPVHSAGALRLGVQVDGEPDGLPSLNSTLDNLTDRDDEDGVEPVGNWLLPDSPVISYTVNGCPNGCYLNMWIDWDGNPQTPILDEVFTNRLVFDGPGQQIPFSRPQGTLFSENINVRVRLCDAEDGCATPHALSPTDAPLGEVEDYRWSFEPTAITLNSFSATPANNYTVEFIIVGIMAFLVLAGTIILFNRRKKPETYS